MDETDGARAAGGGRHHGRAHPPQPAGARAHGALARAPGGHPRRQRRAGRDDRRAHRALAGRPLHRRRAGGRRRGLGRPQPALLAGVLRAAARGARASTCAGARSTSSTATSAPSPPTACRSAWSPRHLARALRAHAVRAARAGRPRGLRARLHRHRLRRAGGGREPGRRDAPLAGLRRHLLQPPPRAHPGHAVRRRDQEGALHGAELPAARARRAAHALLGHGRQAGRRRPVLRSLRHRQDDAVRRSVSPPHRRRRARLERPRRVQLRGRLLRQGHPPLRPRRAADLPGHPLRLGARERGRRPHDARDRLGRRLHHREHARHLPGRRTSPEPSRRGRAACRATSSSSPATPTACCRPSAG